MNLFIEIENGEVKNHPAFKDNLIQAFGEIPTRYEPFIRVARPNPLYQVLINDKPTYKKVDGVWTDVWDLCDMTAEEKTAKQQTVIDAFNAREQALNWSAWTLDEATNTMIPPIPRPEADQAKLDAGIRTFWCGANNNWKDSPPRPEGSYKFDFFAWIWVAV